MKKRDISKLALERPKSDSGVDGVQHQLALPEGVPETDSQVLEATSQKSQPLSAARAFFPSNREDILLQLSSLALSAVFPPDVRSVPICNGGIAVLADGLRTEEAALLSRGQPARFPVLAELREAACTPGARAVSISDVLSLRFRSQQEADDFRFRPVEEFDTGVLNCVAEPSLFGLTGPIRFESGLISMPEARQQAHLADRVAAGICHLLELGEREPSCWHAVADVLCQAADSTELQGLTLRTALSTSAEQTLPDNRQSRTVLQAFISHTRGSPRTLIEYLYNHLCGIPADTSIAQAEERWFKTAQELLQNRRSLDGTLLSDTGFIPLRAALLAATVDNIEALQAFLHADKAAGHRVTAAAAFLIGLKTGITSLSWVKKSRHRDLLSSLVLALQDDDQDIRDDAAYAFQMEPDETPSGLQFQLSWRNRELACWGLGNAEEYLAEPRPQAATTQPVPAATGNPAGQMPDQDRADSASRTDDSVDHTDEENIVLPLPSGKVVQFVRHGSATDLGVSLRYLLSDTDRLRKDKEILQIACMPGLMWRAGRDPDGLAGLYADLPRIPDSGDLRMLAGTLEAALEQYLVRKKVRQKTTTSAVSKSRRKKENSAPTL